MDLRYSGSPAGEAAKHLEKLINNHQGDILCFLAGGSAFEIYKHINPSSKTKGRTIFCMGDERVSREPTENNYLQLMVTEPEFVANNEIINTSVQENENKSKFSLRIEKEILKIISEANNLIIIAILGMGADGHTASIFPMNKKSFEETYIHDSTYVPVAVEGLTVDSRASLTPTFIMNHVNHIIGFITGAAKANKLKDLNEEDFELHEMPAQIIKLHKDAVVLTDIKL